MYRNNVEAMKFYTYNLMKEIRKNFIDFRVPRLMTDNIVDPTNVQATLDYVYRSTWCEEFEFYYRVEFKIPPNVDPDTFKPSSLNEYQINVYLEKPPRE